MQEKMNIQEKLCKIQVELKAPKSQYNGFGKYKYRSCEDILEALKPMLEKYELTVNLSDNLVQVGGRYYVQAIAKITDNKSLESLESFAFAREDETKKGMDGSQITGTASSYARKYALNGLLAIDDTKDSDYPRGDNGKQGQVNKSKSTVTLDMAKDIEISLGEHKGKTLWQVANEDISVIQAWYDAAKGDRKEALKLILDAKEWRKDE